MDSSKEINRKKAWELLCEYTTSESLRKHALAVEATMAALARKYGEDEEKWRIVGILHDMDYEKFPDQHPLNGVDILRERGYPEDIQRAILCHAPRTGITPQTLMEKSLYAVDELCGFIIAVALVRPDQKLEHVSVASVRKKLKDKAFARSVDRDSILRSSELLGTALDDHIAFVIEALKTIASQLGV